METLDIREGTLAEELSDFIPRSFVFRGLPAESMEGLVQSLKFSDPEQQKQVMKLVGKAAKFKGKKKKWFLTQTLFWQGEPIKRDSDTFQKLLDEAFEALFTQNEDAQRVLLATGDAVLTHTLGKTDPTRTVLTEEELVSRLMKLRERLRKDRS